MTSRSCRTWRRGRSTRGSVRCSKCAANCCKGLRAGIHHLRVRVPFSRSIFRRPLDSVNPPANNADAVLMRLPWDTQALAQVQRRLVGALAGGVGPQIEGVAGAATLEALEGVLL